MNKLSTVGVIFLLLTAGCAGMANQSQTSGGSNTVNHSAKNATTSTNMQSTTSSPSTNQSATSTINNPGPHNVNLSVGNYGNQTVNVTILVTHNNSTIANKTVTLNGSQKRTLRNILPRSDSSSGKYTVTARLPSGASDSDTFQISNALAQVSITVEDNQTVRVGHSVH